MNFEPRESNIENQKLVGLRRSTLDFPLFCFGLILIALTSLSGRAADVSVSSVAELATAVAQAQPGDTIVMRDGVWPDADILFSANGVADKPITLRAQTLGRVQLTGQSRLRLAGNFLVVDGLVFTNGYRASGEVIAFESSSSSIANNSRLINCAVVDYNPSDPALDTKWVGLYGLSNRVEYCYFRGKTNAGSTLVVWVNALPDAPNYHVIAHNYFGFRPALDVNGGESIRVGTSEVSFNLSRSTVEENLFERCNGDVEIVSCKSRENIFRHNTFFECEGALTLRHGNGSVVEGNYFFGNHKTNTGGIRIIGDDHKVINNYFVDLAGTSSRAPLAIMQGLVDSPLNGYFQVHRATVAFNTFVNCTNSLLIGLSGTLTGATNVTTLPPVDCTIANNIVVQPAGKIVDQRITPENLVWEGNIFSGASLGITTNSGILRIDPQLALAVDGLWRPTFTSPALGSAQGLYDFVTNDFEGQVRPAVKDIGCDQVSLAPPLYAPLVATNVGPLFMRTRGTFLTWLAPGDLIYGTVLGAAQLNASANAAGTFSYNPPTGTILSVGTGQVLQVVFTPDDLATFNVATQTVTINVLQATPAITWTNPAALTYGTTLGSGQLNAVAAVPGDFFYAPPAGTLLNASNGQVLTVTFRPNDTNNYQSATKAVAIDIRKAVPPIAWANPAAIEQGTALSAAQLNASANVPGTFVYTPALGTVLAGGSHSLSVSFAPADAANYEPADASVMLNVTIGGKTVPTITWTAPSPIIVGAPLGSLQLNAVASVPGELFYSPPAGTVLPAGNGQTLSVTFVPEDNATYTSVTKSVLIDVATLSSNAIVRIAYIVPSNRTPQSHAVATLRNVVLLYQTWFADQMERSGFGRKTFRFETESDGVTPFIHVLSVPQTDSYLRNDAYGNRVLEAVRGTGLPVGTSAQLWWLIPETHVEFPDGSISGSFEFGYRSPVVPVDSGWVMSGSDHLALYQSFYHTNALPYENLVVPDIGPYPLVEDVSFGWFDGPTLSGISSSALGGGLRSLGEGFGLDADYRNDENFNGDLMGLGFRGLRGVFYPKIFPYNYCALSYAAALALSVNPFFNSERVASDITPPNVTITTSGERSPVSGLLQIRFQATDNQALHAALLTWERDAEVSVVEEMTLSGTNASSTFSIPYFNSEETNRYTVTVFDKQGNRRAAQTSIYPKATVNRSPQPFIIVRPLVAGVGQDILLDATDTFDPEHLSNLLEVEWDLDGDGIFDTEPSTDLVFTNNYLALGTYVIRARVTDPAGATAVSAPVAVSITVCPTTLSPLTRFHGFAGSTGVIDVTVGPKCQWSVMNTNDWITILSGASDSGSGQVIYNVLPNPIFADREGTLLIGDETFLVKQHAIECTFSLSPTSRFHGFGTGNNTFKVTTKDGCAWQVVNTNSWISITAGASGISTGTVSYAITDNRVTGRRIGNIFVGDQKFVVNQWGTNCELVLSATSRTHTENSETGSVSVTTASGCPWRVENTNAWITLTTTNYGTNTGSFGYLVAPNPSLIPRTASMFVNGQPFTVTQTACSYSIAPASRSHTYLAQTGTVAVTAGNVCAWTVNNTNDWITIVSAANGLGPDTIRYAVTQNPSGDARSATFTAAGYQFTVTQSGKPCSFVIAPEEFAYGESGGIGEVAITAEANCGWSVVNPASWITILSGAAGDGSGRMTYFVTANNGPARNTTLTVAGQDYSISQASAVRTVAASDLFVASSQTNCLAVTLGAHGGENNFAFTMCFDTNLLVFRSAQLQTNGLPGATMIVNTNQATQGRVGFTVAMPQGTAMNAGASGVVQVCLSALVINGRATTPISLCDAPVERHLADAFGRALPVSSADGSAQIVGLCSLAESLDADFSWKLGAPGAWSCQTNVTHDGVDAAVSAPTPDGGDAYMETTFIGPGALSFWWKVSSEPSSDRLRLYMDGTEQFRISGEVDWEWRTFNIPVGSHVLRWRYSKNSSTAGGADRGWVDQIVYSPAPPSITSQPVSQTADESSTVVFNIVASGQGPLSYQWLWNGIALSEGAATNSTSSIRGAQSSVLTLSNVQPAQAGLYSAIVGNSGGSVASAAALLNVTPAVLLSEALDATNLIWITSGSVAGAAAWFGQPALTHDGVDAARSGAITHGQTTSFETTVNGPGTATFWWKVSSETNNDRLTFFVNGVEQARISGEVEWAQRSFAIGAGAQILRWSYSKNSSISTGQDRGWVDQVEFAPAPVTITFQPVDQIVDPGATAIFAVTASGAPPFSYQWQMNGTNLAESSAVRGTTSATLTISNAQPAQAGTYSVLVSNSRGGVASSNATLQINQLVPLAEALDATDLLWTTNGTPPWVGQTAITHDGSDAARSGRIGDGQTNSFQTIVTGPGVVSFWWKVSSESNDQLRFFINSSAQQSIGGEVDWTWRSFAVGSGNQVLEWRYTKNGSASAGQDRGWVDEIIYVPTNSFAPPVIAIQPTNSTVVAPANVNFYAMAAGSAPLSYQWFFNDTPLTNGNGVSGVTTTNLTLANSISTQAGAYSVRVTNVAGSATSIVATLTVISSPLIVSQPMSQNVAAGSTVNFGVAALGTAPLSYQWQFNGTNIFNGGSVSGASSTNLRITSVVTSNVGNYSVVITNAAGSVTSSVASLVISTPPTITNQPVNKTVAVGAGATFTVGATGSAPLNFQWRLNGANLIDGAGISGATSPTLVLNSIQSSSAGSYSVSIGNAVGVITSANAVLNVLLPPVITSQPLNQNVAEGTNVTFKVVATGAPPLAYHWRSNGTNLVNGAVETNATSFISGATNATLILSNVSPSQSGAYSVEVSNPGGSTVSADAQLTVIPTLTLGDAVNAPYLDWSSGGNAPWTAQTNITHDGEAAAQSGNNANGSTWIETTITGPGTIRFWWRVSSQTNADVLSFAVNGTTWAQISGDVNWNKQSFPLPPGALTLRWTYTKDSALSSGLDRAWLDEVDFLPTIAPTVPVIVGQPNSQSVDLGATVTFAAEALGTAPLSYQWRFEGQNLSDSATVLGANSPTLRLFNAQAAQSGMYDLVVRNAYSLEISEPAFLSVFTTIPLTLALDTEHTNLFWRTGGYSPWRGQTLVSADSFDAAQSSPVANGATNWLEATLPAPCALAFWWKVSSETNHDFLRFLVDGVEVAKISGEVDWQQRSFPITTANAVLRWAYTKDATGSAGQDRAWLDRIQFLAISPLVTNAAPDTNIVDQGTTVAFKVDASGTLPLSYQWRRNGTNLVESASVIGATTAHRVILSNAQPSQTGFYTCQVANDGGADISPQMYLKVNTALPIAPAVNTPTWVWETGGYSWFVGTTSGSHDGNQCVRNGYVNDGASCWMRTTITGPGTLRFWWKCSTQPNFDVFRFSINDVVQSQISGSVSWQQKTFTLPAGSSVVRWEYSKDLLLTNGTDQVFVDEVSFTPAPPSFVTQPSAQAADAGSTVTFTAVLAGAPPFSYRWRYNGVTLADGGNISGATNATLRISGVKVSQAGAYSLVVSNVSGSVTSSNASLAVTAILPLGEALDATNFVWATGSPPWVGQPAVTHDGVDAARSPITGDDQDASAQATITGPGTLSFWWKVSSETNKDFLIFYLGDVEQARISGEVNWQQKTFSVPAGDQTVKWSYSKDSSGVAGQDRGWVDQFVFTPRLPSITSHPASQTVEEGTRVLFAGLGSGTPPLTYQWRFNGNDLANGGGISGAKATTLIVSNALLARAGDYTLVVSNAEGFAISSNAVLDVTPLVPLSVALDVTNVWTTNGTPPWVGQLLVSHDGTDAARSGAIGDNGSNSMQTTVTGPGTLSFWWKVSSETNNDRMIFTVNNVEQARISGEVDWDFRTFTLGSGAQTLKWSYSKNASLAAGLDRGWVDEVLFGPQPPTITSQPANQNVDAGSTANFRVVVAGAPPLTYQWQRDNVNLVNGGGISGATSSNLVLTVVQTSQAGNYRVIINGAAGVATSAVAVLSVFTPLPLDEALDTTNLIWTSTGTPWIGHGLVTHDGIDAARSGTIGNSADSRMQTTVNGPGTLTFWWKVSSEPSNDRLAFFIDGTEQARISGEVDWAFYSSNVASGAHVLEWRYTKNSSTSAGQDRGWVDQVQFGTVAPFITAQPTNAIVDPGDAATFNIIAVGTAPLTYRWLFNGAPLADGFGVSGASTATLTIANAQFAQAGIYSVTVSNSAGGAASANATLSLLPSLEEALDTTGLTVTTGGTGQPWHGRQTITHDGIDAAQSGAVVDSTYTWIKTVVQGPNTLMFWWKVSSETNHDWLRFMLDAADQMRISGEVDWQQITFNVPSGSHELQWRYSKNSSGSAGQDRAWVDQLSFGTAPPPPPPPTTATPPVILIQPVSQTVDQGTTVNMNVAATGTAPLSYQWRFNGTNAIHDNGNVGGATTAELTLFNILPTQAGNYSVVVTNSGGAVTSLLARLTVNHLLTLAEAVDIPELFMTSDGDALWEGHTVVTHDGIDAARSGHVGDGQSSSMQTLVDGPGTLNFWWKVSSETNADVLVVSLNGQLAAFISGEVDWEQLSLDLASGPQFLEWTYFKNDSVSAGDDRGWVDQLSFVPAGGALAPRRRVATGGIAPRISILENKIQITWEARASRGYEVLYKDDLSESEWKPLDSEVLATWKIVDGTVQSDTYGATVEDLPAPQSRFYRVLEY